ncbi:dnaJ [Symbiodinium natans]|uniref:DnaJ protein n=1 Tax=Symbiodinium natans TaxID=878477 RepID=A0A812SHV8_9DINO|nr:dnaJ [Symbiodinium natans]
MAEQAVREVAYMAKEALMVEQAREEKNLELAESGPAEYLVDNSVLQAHAPGITFRFSKRMEDRDDLGELAAFGTSVLGIDEGDGWLRVQNPHGEIRYLPTEIQGVTVLSRAAATQQRQVREERQRRAEAAERQQKDLEAWQRRAEEAERLRQERLKWEAERKAKEKEEEDPQDPLRRTDGRKIAGRTRGVLERHYAGEEEEVPDHYQVLGVARHATPEEITQAYRALAKLYHPDRLKSSGGVLSQAAAQRSHEQRMALLNAAHRVLSDPRLRLAYDKTLPEPDEAGDMDFAPARGSEKSEEQYDFDFLGSDRPFRVALGRAARAAKACGSRDAVRTAMDQLRGKERMALADKDGQIRPSGPTSPFSGLGSCADPDCRAHRLAWPQVRTRFRDFILSRIRAAVRREEGAEPWWNPDLGLRYTSVGSGQLLFDLELLERIRFLGVRIAQICLIDTAYAGSPPSVDVRRALREFTDWQRAASQLCRHEPAEVLVFSEVWDYYETCCESQEASSKYPDLERYRQPCDLFVHCDATWPGADEEIEQLAQTSLSRGGLLVRLSPSSEEPQISVAGDVETNTNRSGHSLAPLLCRAWVQMDASASREMPGAPARPLQPILVEVEEDAHLEECREAIEDTKTSEPKCDLELARILADARENARKEAQRKKPPPEANKPGQARRIFEAPVREEDLANFSFRNEQPPIAYFRDRKVSRTRVPGKGRDIEKGKVFDSFKFLTARDDEPDTAPAAHRPASKQGLVPWKVVYPSPVAMRSTPKATGRLVGQLHPGDIAYCSSKERAGDWVRVEEVPGQNLPDEVWVLTDGTEFGMGVLLQQVDAKAKK